MSGEPVTGTTYTGSLSELLWAVSQTATWGETWDKGGISSVHQRMILGDTPLHTVCTWGFTEPVEMLIGHGADVNARGEHDDTPLMRSVIGRNPAVIDLLLRHGADANLTNQFGLTARTAAIRIGTAEGRQANPMTACFDNYRPRRPAGHEVRHGRA